MRLRMSDLKGKEIGDDGILYTPLSFVLPFTLVMVVCIVLEIVPFGEHTFAISDGRYAMNGLAFLSRLLHGEENALYSFNNGLGGNEWSVLSWGGLNPVSFIAYFSSLERLPECFTWIVTISISFSGLFFYLSLADYVGHRTSNLLFSTSYALMGFHAAYFIHSGFFIGSMALPLMQLGLHRLFREQSPILYISSLGICIFLSFYFGFMLCIASLVILLAYIYSKCNILYGKKVRLIGTWTASTVIAGLLASPMWLPAIKAFSGGGRIDQALDMGYSIDENMPFIQIFAKLFTGTNSQMQEINGLPNIFCGILVVALVILFFTNRHIEKRKKQVVAVVLGFYLLTFYISVFTKLMHGGTHTNWFNYRYSFVFSFFLIGIAAEEFQHLDEITLKDTQRCGATLLISTILVVSTNYEFLSGGYIVFDFVLLLIMWALFRMHQRHPLKMTVKLLSGLLILTVSVNLFANFANSILSLRSWELDMTLYKANVLFSGSSVDAIHQVDTGFFRMEKDVSESGTMGLDSYLYNYNGVGYSGPAVRKFNHSQLNKLGINWYDMRHWYQAGVPTSTDALLGLKYILASREDIGEEKGYTKISSTPENAIYRNDNALGIAILANDEVKGLELGNNAFESLNEVWKGMTGGTEDVFLSENEVSFTLHNIPDEFTIGSEELKNSVSKSEEDSENNSLKNTAYVEMTFTAKRTGPVYRWDMSVPASDWGSDTPAVKYCGYYERGETVIDTSATNASYVPLQEFAKYCSNIVYAYEDHEVVARYAKELNERDISFEVVKETDLKGTFHAGEGQRILFTIPWDEGWTCYIDGKKAPIDKTWELFMSVEAPVGVHTYEMKFFPAWMDYGLYLCGASAVGLVVLMLVRNKRRRAITVTANEVQNDSVETEGTEILVQETTE